MSPSVRVVYQVYFLFTKSYSFASYDEGAAIDFARSANQGLKVPAFMVERQHLVAEPSHRTGRPSWTSCWRAPEGDFSLLIGSGLVCRGLMNTSSTKWPHGSPFTCGGDYTLIIQPAGPNRWTLDPQYTHGATYTLTYEPDEGLVSIRHLGHPVHRTARLGDLLVTMATKLGII